MDMFAVIAVFAPLVGAGLVGLGMGRPHFDHMAEFLTCCLMVCASVSALFVIKAVCFEAQTLQLTLFPWVEVQGFQVSWGIYVDALTAVMMGVVTFVSTMVHLYAIGYMHGDKSIPRFMAYLSLFTFFMLSLVTAPNLLQVFFGWEGVGVASYLLIGFWYERPSAGAAAIKAFLVNRVGDIGLALGVFSAFFLFNSVNFNEMFTEVPRVLDVTFALPGLGEVHALSFTCLCLFIGAMGKSAQFGLHVWLPDAMEGPTPVSALIHAATMVTAGVFLMVRLSPMLEYTPSVQTFILVIGGITAFFAATVACTQTDIKRVIAYSTCSQLGYMFAAIGVSAYGAAIFHLATHAFFKALLFLSAGSVIHAVSGSQDLREMGGLWRLIPFTYVAVWIGNLALAGIPYFAGYYSKDIILESLYARGTFFAHFAFAMGIIAAFLTAFYSWRLLVLTFHGKSRMNEAVLSRVHESPLVMLLPLFFLEIGAIFAGYLGQPLFVGEGAHNFWNGALFVSEHSERALSGLHHLPQWVVWLPLIVGVGGISLAFFCYSFVKSIPGILAKRFQFFYHFFLSKWYIDELYNFLFINPSWRLGSFLWQKGDVGIIDAYGPDGVSALTLWKGKCLSKLQTGFVSHYAFSMLLALFSMIVWFFWVLKR
jgi:NADH-quinone oxidoreductase subunit L